MRSTKSRAEAQDSLLGAWRTNCRVTAFLVERLPAAFWDAPVTPRKTVRMLLAHFHNSRAGWIRTLGTEHGIATPARVDPRTVTRAQLSAALRRSAEGIAALLKLGLVRGGAVPPSKRYVWRNLPLDVGHVLTYFVAHEGHHRGQILMLARQLRQPLPRPLKDGMWEWRARMREWRERAS